VTSQFPYTKLPGTRRGLIRKAALWEGADHILSVSGTRFSENYRRFYYHDIQALVIEKRARAGSIGVWVLTVFPCAILILFASISRIYGIGTWLPIALLTLYLIYRLIVSLAYSCRCYIQTAVTREELPSLYRIWNAQKAFARMRAKITESQGTLAEDPQTLVEMADALSLSGSLQAPKREMQETPLTTQARATSMNLALLGCITLLVIAAFLFWHMDAADRVANSLGMLTANALLALLSGAGFVLSLLRIYKTRALQFLRNFLFAALCLLGLHVYFLVMVSRLYQQDDPFSTAVSSPAFRHWFSLIDGSLSLALGLFGVAFIVFNWQNYREGPTSNS
jgi:hypothetical protein